MYTVCVLYENMSLGSCVELNISQRCVFVDLALSQLGHAAAQLSQSAVSPTDEGTHSEKMSEE